MSLIRRLFLISLLGVTLFVGIASAADINLVYKPPCLLQGEEGVFGKCVDATSSITQYIVNIYRFGMGIAGILAVGMIVAGAVYMSISSSSVDKKSEGRDMITSALMGIGLLFGSYLILNTINPELIKLKDPAIESKVFSNTYSSMSMPLTHVSGCNSDEMGACVGKGGGYALYTKYNTSTQKAAPGTQQCLNAVPGPETGLVLCVDTLSGMSREVWCKTVAGLTPETVAQHAGWGVEYLNDCVKGEIAKDLVSIQDDFSIKPGQCHWGNTKSEPCKVGGSSFRDKLIAMRDALTNNGVGRDFYWVSEAWPPTVHHSDSCHTMGTCVDIGVNATLTCTVVQKIIDKASAAGLRVTNEYLSCPDTTPAPRVTTFRNGDHIHIEQ